MKKNYRLLHRRRREKRTDYNLRLSLLKSGKFRLVVRKSNNYITGHIVKYEKNGDRTLASVSSRLLKKMGWKNSCGNIPAAYLTGLILGKRAKEKDIKEVVLDLGLQTSTKGNRVYALLKGVSDSGLEVGYSEDVLPSEDRIKGKHIGDEIVKDFEVMKNKVMK